MRQKQRTLNNAEKPAEISFWLKDGSCAACKPRQTAETQVSIGRTDSKRALGFIVKRHDTRIDFVLDKEQTADLAAYLHLMDGGLSKPLGRRKAHQNRWHDGSL